VAWSIIALLTEGPGQTIRIGMKTARSVLDSVVKFGQRLNPSSRDSLGAFEGAQHILMSNGQCTELLWPRQGNDGSAGGLRLPQAAPAESDNNFVVQNSSRAKKGDGALYSFHRGVEYCAHRDIRRISVQNESLVWLGVSQSDRLGEGSLEALEGLLSLR